MDQLDCLKQNRAETESNDGVHPRDLSMLNSRFVACAASTEAMSSSYSLARHSKIVKLSGFKSASFGNSRKMADVSGSLRHSGERRTFSASPPRAKKRLYGGRACAVRR